VDDGLDVGLESAAEILVESRRGKAASLQRSAFSGQLLESHDQTVGQGGMRIFAWRKEARN
jgi:hypothetical protein